MADLWSPPPRRVDREEPFVVDGHTAIRAEIRTGRGEFRSHIRIDATDADYRHGDVFEKKTGARLVVEGDLVRVQRGLRVRRASGQLGELRFAGRAEIDRPTGPGRSTALALHFEPIRPSFL